MESTLTFKFPPSKERLAPRERIGPQESPADESRGRVVGSQAFNQKSA